MVWRDETDEEGMQISYCTEQISTQFWPLWPSERCKYSGGGHSSLRSQKERLVCFPALTCPETIAHVREAYALETVGI